MDEIEWSGPGRGGGRANGAVLDGRGMAWGDGEGKMGWHGHGMGQGGAGRDGRAHLTAGSCLHELSA